MSKRKRTGHRRPNPSLHRGGALPEKAHSGAAIAPPKPGSIGPDRHTATREPPHALDERAGGHYWLYGRHAVTAALLNPRRRSFRLLATAEAEAGLAASLATAPDRRTVTVERVDRARLALLLGTDCVHQGLALEVAPLPAVELEAVAGLGGDGRVLVLDQVTDPQNVGAILRSGAAFGAAAVILPERHAAPESGALAKAASGALERVPLVRVVNLARALDRLKGAGFWCIGLAAEGREELAEVDLSGRIAFVLGAEGSGLRRLTRDRCDLLVRLPTAPGLIQLNVSNAAAVALYELARHRSGAANRVRP